MLDVALKVQKQCAQLIEMVEPIQKTDIGDQKELFQFDWSQIKTGSIFIKQNLYLKYIESSCLLTLRKNTQRKTIAQ